MARQRFNPDPKVEGSNPLGHAILYLPIDPSDSVALKFCLNREKR